jgi:nucleotide-binding universal stress UspA family protein
VHNDLQGVQGVEIDIMVERGEPATRILDVIERLGCECVVTGVARDETLGRLLLGTTVETLTRQANVPVLVVKSRPRTPYRNVVVATDFSEGSRCALEAALALLPTAQVQTPPTHPLPLCELKPTVLGAWSRRGSPASSRVTIAC